MFMTGSPQYRLQDEAEAAQAAQKTREIEARLEIKLSDPAVTAAAARIQAGFRGVLARRSLRIIADRAAQNKGDEKIKTGKETIKKETSRSV